MKVTDEMVTRFLGWKLPKDFMPDGGVTFKPIDHPNLWPVGTNLLTADQARAMLEHVLAETPGPKLCSCQDGARYRFIRQGEDALPTEQEEAFAAMWEEISHKGCWRERMDKRIDEAMQQLGKDAKHG